jgi:hypothetical protein
VNEDDNGLHEPQPDDWIIVRNWERFQHYHDRPQPQWVKVYTSLLHDPKFLELSMGARGLLVTIWMAFGTEKGTIRVQDVSHFAHKRVSNVQLISLNHAGFIHFSASKPLDTNVELEVEDKELKGEPVEKQEPVVRRREDEPSLMSEAFELVSQWAGGTSEEFVEMLDRLERNRRATLRESERTHLWDHIQKRAPAVPAVPASPDDDIPF